jgi:hypothetical protein
VGRTSTIHSTWFCNYPNSDDTENEAVKRDNDAAKRDNEDRTL